MWAKCTPTKRTVPRCRRGSGWIESGVVSEVINLESSGVGAPGCPRAGSTARRAGRRNGRAGAAGHQRRTLAANALIASSYLAGTKPRRGWRSLRCLAARLEGHGEPDVAQGEERLGRLECPLARGEPIVRLIRDGTVVRVRLNGKATSISLLVVLGVRADGHKMCSRSTSMGGRAPRRRRQAMTPKPNLARLLGPPLSASPVEQDEAPGMCAKSGGGYTAGQRSGSKG